jgi:hypothetical protein
LQKFKFEERSVNDEIRYEDELLAQIKLLAVARHRPALARAVQAYTTAVQNRVAMAEDKTRSKFHAPAVTWRSRFFVKPLLSSRSAAAVPNAGLDGQNRG